MGLFESSYMKRALALLRSLAVITLVTLLLDFSITSFIPNDALDDWVALRTADDLLYQTDVPWHHELKPGVKTSRRWDGFVYPHVTDSFGFRTGACAADAPRQGTAQHRLHRRRLVCRGAGRAVRGELSRAATAGTAWRCAISAR
jgi:hypothetical protein